MTSTQLPYVENIQFISRKVIISVERIRALSFFDSAFDRKLGITFLLIAMLTSSIISRFSNKRRIVKLATTPRTVFDESGLLISNTFAFIIFPAFVLINVVIIQWIIWGGKIYGGKILTIGYFLHTSTGSLYFIAGGLQFYSPLRQHYPKIHRIIGYLYYIMAFITSIGILILTIKPHSGFPTQVAVATFLPPWIACNYLALRAILLFRDVELHRQLNIVGLATASAIIFMRPLVMIVMVMEAPTLFGKALAIAVWIAFVWFLFGSLFYILHTYTLPTLRFKRLQNNGSYISTGYIHCPLQDFASGVTIYSYKMIDSRTILMILGEHKSDANQMKRRDIQIQDIRIGIKIENEEKIVNNIQKEAVEILNENNGKKNAIKNENKFLSTLELPPGCHFSLKLGDVVREFTPINNENEDSSSIQILVRLIPNGKFSLLISKLLGLKDADMNTSEYTWIDCNVPCSVYGPLFSLPSKFGYFPYYGVDAKFIDKNADHSRSDDKNNGIYIGDVKNRNDGRLPRIYSNDNGNCSNYSNILVSPMIILIGAGTGVTPFLSIIEAALKNKKDRTRIRLLSLTGKSNKNKNKNFDENNFSSYMKSKVDYLKRLSEFDSAMTDDRFDSINIETRFLKSMLELWIYSDPSSTMIKDNPFQTIAVKQSFDVRRRVTDDTIVWICGPPGFGESIRTLLTNKCTNSDSNSRQYSFLKEQIFVIGVDDR